MNTFENKNCMDFNHGISYKKLKTLYNNIIRLLTREWFNPPHNNGNIFKILTFHIWQKRCAPWWEQFCLPLISSRYFRIRWTWWTLLTLWSWWTAKIHLKYKLALNQTELNWIGPQLNITGPCWPCWPCLIPIGLNWPRVAQISPNWPRSATICPDGPDCHSLCPDCPQ